MSSILEKEVNFIQLLRSWSQGNLLGIFIFNMCLMILVLLHEAGYFNPYFPITINMIVFLCLVLAVFLFRARSNMVFLTGLIFWFFTTVFRLLYVDVWAERTAIYAYEALMLGTFILIIENIKRYVKQT